MALELTHKDFESVSELACFVKNQLQYLVTARPTAVNMTNAAHTLTASVEEMASANTLLVNRAKER